jgi:hypothetical protein
MQICHHFIYNLTHMLYVSIWYLYYNSMVVSNIDNILFQDIHLFSVPFSHNLIFSFLSFQILFKVVSFSFFNACFCSQSLLFFLILPCHHQSLITIKSNERLCFLSKNADTADSTKFEVHTNAIAVHL